MLSFVILLVGFVLLVVGADKFVEGSSAFASRLGVPSLIIGLTIVAFGTSAPELAVSVTASFQNANEIVLGNVIGSNIFNLLVVAGTSAIIAPLVIERELLKRDWLCSIFASIALAIFMLLDNNLTILEGTLLLMVFIAILAIQIKSALKSQEKIKLEEIEVKESKKLGKVRIALYMIFGITAIVLGGQFAVQGATEIAQMFGISETIIGLTVVAIGTSLPELVTSIVATKRGEHSIAIGNVIGSNIFNVLFILGLSVMLNPVSVQMTGVFDNLILLASTAILFFIAKFAKIGRFAGVLMVATYIVYNVWIVIR